jgi:hypothetical protein
MINRRDEIYYIDNELHLSKFIFVSAQTVVDMSCTKTYRKNRINIEQDANEREENAHGDFRERNTYILDEYNRT